MPSTLFNGSLQATTDVVHIAGSIATSGVYTYQVDVGRMGAGEEIELRVANSVGAGTVSCIYLASYANQQAQGIKASPPFVVGGTNAHVSLKRRAGATSTWFFFEVLSI